MLKQIINQVLGTFDLRLSRVSKGSPIDAYSPQQELLKITDRKCETIFDIGANIGTITRRYRKLFPEASIHSFEPFPDSFQKLKENTKTDSNVVINQFAITESEGEEKFFVNHSDPTNSLFERPKKGKRYYPENATAKEEILVQSLSIDKYVEEQSIPHIDILKMDIQGGELRALKGAVDMLKRGSISMVYSEVMYIPHYEGSPMMHEIWSFLSEFDYSLYNIYNNSIAGDGQLRQGDAIFLSPALREKFDSIQSD
ncbi:FkbM family methyltransferase [Rubellicoccus peritrichatus]|uniref:FkbM family methyltransferase n=1 Tax=Rubellicoccus peritrichatus TaxID=3080537 RepID=A0AAQ3L6H3_9BACT|nr:FkbM family methyltransferase [Puniceicoccus sp. CR14]WOO39876.1 FkbM family methyltransferase [Puniceicoccus sp. CR14]